MYEAQTMHHTFIDVYNKIPLAKLIGINTSVLKFLFLAMNIFWGK